MAPAPAFDQEFDNYWQSGALGHTANPFLVPVSGIPDGATVLLWVVEFHFGDTPSAVILPPPGFVEDAGAGFTFAFVFDSMHFYHKRYEGESDFEVGFVPPPTGAGEIEVGAIVASFTDLPPHDFIRTRTGGIAGGSGMDNVGVCPETYGTVFWYGAGDSVGDVARADDSLATLFGVAFGGVGFVVQEFSLHSTTVPTYVADGTLVDGGTRSSLVTWGDPSTGAGAVDEWTWDA